MDIDMPAVGLSSALREATQALHIQAERSGIVADILRGRATVRGYAMFLRNLAPAYRRLETGLERHRLTPGLQAFARPELYRSAALEADLAALAGAGWREALTPFAASDRYARSVDDAANGSGAGLIGHAYVRYLGDLSGGQTLKRLLAAKPGISPSALCFYDFPDINDLSLYKARFRDALDDAPLTARDRASVLAAAVEAFAINIEISEAVRGAVVDLD